MPCFSISSFSVRSSIRNITPGTVHIESFKYLFEGLHGHNQLVPWIWTAMAMNVTAFFLFLVPSTRKRLNTLNLGCLLVIIGVWIEKGPGLDHPGIRSRSFGRDL